jgi:hypothetical protein
MGETDGIREQKIGKSVDGGPITRDRGGDFRQGVVQKSPGLGHDVDPIRFGGSGENK